VSRERGGEGTHFNDDRRRRLDFESFAPVKAGAKCKLRYTAYVARKSGSCARSSRRQAKGEGGGGLGEKRRGGRMHFGLLCHVKQE